MQDKKKIVIGVLCALIMIMAVGYALLSQQLSINGSANITSTWKIEITNITEKERHGGVTEKSKSYDAMTANFDVGFTSPGDYITYDVEVTNSGTLDAVIERINIVTNDNPAIIYTTSGIKRGDVIEHNSKKYLTVKIEYDSSVTSQPQTNNNALTLQLFTAQNLGQVEPEYQTYSVGDKITFAGSDWYVIKDSTSDEDYVTVTREKVLANAELENYAYNNEYDTMEFTWTETCHNANHGYTEEYFDCSNTNNYDNSKIKEFLEETYIKRLGENNLKEIDGYKVRLITKEEFYDYEVSMSSGDPLESLKWVYQNFGENGNVHFYWTMTPNGWDSSGMYVMCGDGHFRSNGVSSSHGGVRPVINLLKSATE